MYLNLFETSRHVHNYGTRIRQQSLAKFFWHIKQFISLRVFWGLLASIIIIVTSIDCPVALLIVWQINIHSFVQLVTFFLFSIVRSLLIFASFHLFIKLNNTCTSFSFLTIFPCFTMNEFVISLWSIGQLKCFFFSITWCECCWVFIYMLYFFFLKIWILPKDYCI